MYPTGPMHGELPPNYATDIEPCLCDCTVSQLRAIASSINDKAYQMEESLNKTVTVDDFVKRMKSSTQSIPTMSPSGFDMNMTAGDASMNDMGGGE